MMLDEYYEINNKISLEKALQISYFTLNYLKIKVTFISLNASSSNEILSELTNLINKQVYLNIIEIISSKLTFHSLKLFFDTLNSSLSNNNNRKNKNFKINLKGSLKHQNDLNLLLTLKKQFITYLNISTTSRIIITDLLAYYLPSHSISNNISNYDQTSYLLTLILDDINITSDDAIIIQSNLQNSSCSLKELSLRSCGFSRDESIFSIILSGLPYNTSLISLDISDNLIRNDDIGAACLHLLKNTTLKRVLYENTHISVQQLFCWGLVLKYSSVRYLSLKECSIKDRGLHTFFLGYASSWPIVPFSHNSHHHLHMLNDSNSPQINIDFLSILDSFIDSNEILTPTYPSIAVLDLSYNKITNYSLLSPLFDDPLIGLSELHLSGNKITIDDMRVLSEMIQKSCTLQRLYLSNCGLDRESSAILFHMLHKSWSRSHIYQTPLVNLSYPILSSNRSIQQYLEWITNPIILRHDYNEIIRGIHDTVTPIPPQDNKNSNDNDPSNYRLFPPLAILNLESNLIGWMGISILSTCLNTRKWNSLEELYVSGNKIGIRGYNAFLQIMRLENKFRLLKLKKNDLLIEDNELESLVLDSLNEPYDVNDGNKIKSSRNLLYTISLPLENKLTFLLCLKYYYQQTNSINILSDDILGMIFLFLRIPVYRTIQFE